VPPIGLHMILGRELAGDLRHPVLEADRGAFYLGTSAPDINVLTRWERERTHFFDLADYGEQHAVEGLFREHPGLTDTGGLNSSTPAFLAGYVSHLVVDEAWINDIYRPCFGRRSPLGGSELANVMDRLLQFELYRRERTKSGVSDEIRDDLVRSPLEIEVDFIDGETLRRWRDIAVELLAYPADWQRFGLIASRFLKAYGVETPEQYEAFLKDVPDLLRRTERHVTRERLERFLESSRLRSLEAIREYLR
jgi:hypothetical protein